jgi:hypothetical protein
MKRGERWIRLVVVAIIIGTSLGLSLTYLGVGEALGLVPHPPLRDWYAYWDAAQRLRDGEALYPALSNENLETTYRYAPWFAYVWVPLTFLPREVVGVSWVVVMFAVAVVALIPLLRSGRLPAVLLAALLAPFLAQGVAQGNVQPAVVALLVHGLGTRWGPGAIAVAASLKAFPILYAGRYALLGEWRKFAISIAITVLLVAPILLLAPAAYPLEAGPIGSLWLISPFAWAAGLIIGLTIAVRFARSRAGWFASSLAVVLATTRLQPYDLTFLLVVDRNLLRRGEAPSMAQARQLDPAS